MDPKHYIVNHQLKDGGSIHIRSIRKEDKVLLYKGFHKLSDDSIYFRFLQVKKELSEEELAYFTEVDFVNHVALVVTISENDDEKIIGVGRYVVLDDNNVNKSAEVAFTIADEHQGRGIGTLLFKHLVIIARFNKIAEFQAEILAYNQRMLKLISTLGFKIKRSLESGVFHVFFSITGHESFSKSLDDHVDEVLPAIDDYKMHWKISVNKRQI
ncbi:GNAT family N-acetyltransferase [candidate division CSSED10-310 bacterium]|uniref:GNAT family N-acetyltransferase n=1 Tax=candidate division CSSED10-310 bacterium TaxID=2855610 RepID=A0ABV6YZ96_UNCC1